MYVHCTLASYLQCDYIVIYMALIKKECKTILGLVLVLF